MAKLSIRPDGTSGKCRCRRPSWFSDIGPGVVAAQRCNNCLGWEDPVEGERVQAARRIYSFLIETRKLPTDEILAVVRIAVTVGEEELVRQ